MTSDPRETRGSDGGSLGCGSSGPFEALSSATAIWVRHPLNEPQWSRGVSFDDEAIVRRALSVFPRESDLEIALYLRVEPTESAEVAQDTLRELLSDNPGLVLDEEERAGFLESLSELDAILAAHPDDIDVQTRSRSRAPGARSRRRPAFSGQWGAGTTRWPCSTRAPRSIPDTGALQESARTCGQAERYLAAAERCDRALERDPEEAEARALATYLRYLHDRSPRSREAVLALARKYPDDEYAQHFAAEATET